MPVAADSPEVSCRGASSFKRLVEAFCQQQQVILQHNYFSYSRMGYFGPTAGESQECTYYTVGIQLYPFLGERLGRAVPTHSAAAPLLKAFMYVSTQHFFSFRKEFDSVC